MFLCCPSASSDWLPICRRLYWTWSEGSCEEYPLRYKKVTFATYGGSWSSSFPPIPTTSFSTSGGSRMRLVWPTTPPSGNWWCTTLPYNEIVWRKIFLRPSFWLENIFVTYFSGGNEFHGLSWKPDKFFLIISQARFGTNIIGTKFWVNQDASHMSVDHNTIARFAHDLFLI